MTISVRVSYETGGPNQRVAVVLVDKKSKKSQLFTKLSQDNKEAVVTVHANQDIALRETE